MIPSNGVQKGLLLLLIAAVTGACEQRPVDLAPHTPHLAWTTIASVPDSRPLTTVWGSSWDDVYVGYPRYRRDSPHTLLHFDGSSWTETPFQGSRYSYHLRIWGTGPDDVYIADGALHHFDGASWTELPVFADVVGGAGPDNVYAADYTRVYHFDGTIWRFVYEMHNGYGAVHAIWAGGDDVVILMTSGLVTWDGATWQEIDARGGQLDVWGVSADNLMIVGDRTSTNSQEIAWRFDGSTFSPVAVPEGTRELWGVWGTASNDMYAVESRGRILHYDGVAWTLANWSTNQTLADIWGTGPSDIYAVSWGEKVLHFDGNNWATVWNTPGDIDVAWAASASQIVSASRVDPSIYFFENGQWREVFPGVANDVVALGGTSLNDVYASMSNASILHYDGASWSVAADSLAGIQRDLWAAPTGEVFSVGWGSAYRGGNGTGWNVMLQGDFELFSVWGSSASNVIAVGADVHGGLILRYDGVSWRKMESGAQRLLRDVWGASENDVFAVGEAGILHYDGATWQSQPGYHSTALFAVSGRGRDDVIAVGYTGLLQYDGHLWNYARADFRDIFAARDGSVLARRYRTISLYGE